MAEARGLVLRVLPYSDSAFIVKCFSENDGLDTYFLRANRSKRTNGHMQNGSFIQFTSSVARHGLSRIEEAHWDSGIPSSPLLPDKHAIWLFTLELLLKSLPERFPIPSIKQRLDAYYTLLVHDIIESNAAIPLIAISHDLGLTDLDALAHTYDIQHLAPSLALLSLHTPAIEIPNAPYDFDAELKRFMAHYEIRSIETLSLL